MARGIEVIILLGLLFLAGSAHAHDVETGDPAHDASHVTVSHEGGLSIPLWGVGLFILGLIIFALAMGYFLQPAKKGRS